MVDNSEKDKGGSSEIWQDPRFSHLVRDPRFKQPRKVERKVKIDKRFEAMFKDERFKIKYTIDKYGRKVNKTSSEDLKKYYDIDSTDDEEERRNEEKEIAKVDLGGEPDLNDKLCDDGEEITGDIKKKLLDSKYDYARGEGRLLTDSSSDEELSEDDEVFIEHVWGELDNDAMRTDKSTKRLAVCNMDWDRIRAVDIMVLCNSFLPPGGSIIRVSIYPSEFGKERMAEEEIKGPLELTKSESESEEELLKEEGSDVEEGDEFHMEKLRQYQLNRLKYYYAVIECDTVATADKLYKECDGLEYESTATKLDLRFIPDDVNFECDGPREVCTELPDMKNYKPRLFTTAALYQAKVDLTWDENNIERKELSEKLAAGKIEEVKDDELRRYVAYSSEDSENEEKGSGEHQPADMKVKGKIISAYKSLLETINQKEEEKTKKKCEMEYTWSINVDNKSKDFENSKKDLTPIEKILQKRQEKNRLRKEQRKKLRRGSDGEGSSSDDLPDDVDMSDPYFAEEFANEDFKAPKKKEPKSKTSKKHLANCDIEQEEKNEKELELLLDDGETEKKHFSLEKIQKLESESKSKRKRRKMLKRNKREIEAGNTETDNFEVKLDDKRFSAIFTSHLFNIDPSDPHFKKTKGMEKLIQEKIKRRDPSLMKSTDRQTPSDKPQHLNVSLENRLLVKRLKRKLEAKNV